MSDGEGAAVNSRLAIREMPGVNAQDSTAMAARDGCVDERLIAVREDVLHDVEHAVGNLLQRMHHAARSAGTEMGAHGERLGERLEGALTDLERLLDLLFGYVSPVDVELKPTDAERVAESLAAHLRGQGVEVAVAGVPAIRVLADPRALGRSFQLLVESRSWAGPFAVAVIHDVAAERVEFTVRGAAESTPPGAQGALAAAVAGRLIDLQGGELRQEAGGGCAVTLPVAG
jgi:hypothetical protein